MGVKQHQQDKIDAIERLLADDGYSLTPGSVVYTTTLHTSRSGMTRHIKVTRVIDDTPHDISGLVARATGSRWHDDGGVVVGGCGMDMGFSLVYDLSRTLYPKGHDCTGKGYRDGNVGTCPSNDHNNDYNESMRMAKVRLGHDAYRHDLSDDEFRQVRNVADEIRNNELGYRVDRHHSDGGYAISQRWL